MQFTGRRAFLRDAAYFACLQPAARLALAVASTQQSSGLRTSAPKVDTHIHLYDPSRPGGIPWPTSDDSILYHPALPDRYRSMAVPYGIVGAIAIECSPLAKDNDWLLQTAGGNDFIIGVIGDLDPDVPDFSSELKRLQLNPLFRGIRYGNLWGRNLGAGLKKASFVDHLREFSESGLVLESANPNPKLIAELVQLTKLVPGLRIVIDHLPQAPPSEDFSARDQYLSDLHVLSGQSNLFVKGSEILRRIDGTVSSNIEIYRPWLDKIWEIFGDDRILFGSDWPNSDSMAPFADTLSIAQRYILTRGSSASQKYWWRNSQAAYRWKPRNNEQANLLRTEVL